MLKQAVEVLEADSKSQPADVISAVDNLAVLEAELGNYAEAENQYRKALAVQQSITGGKPEALGFRLTNLALVLYPQTKYDEAEALFKQALDIF